MQEVIALEGLDRADWLEARRRGIGGSDIAAIMGLDNYRSALDVYASKVVDEPDDRDSPLMRLGRLMEDGICQAYAEDTGSEIAKPTHLLAHDDHPWMLANIDRWTDNAGPGVLEAKMSGRVDQWADGVPDGYALQAHWYLGVTGLPYADLAVLLGGRELRYFQIERDQTMIDQLIEIGAEFWHRVERREPPLADAKSEDALRRLYGNGGAGALELDPGMALTLSDLRAAKAAAKAAEENAKRLGNEVRGALADYETGTLGGVPVVTWSKSLRTGIDTKRLEEQEPEIAEKFRRAAPVRTLRLRKGSP